MFSVNTLYALHTLYKKIRSVMGIFNNFYVHFQYSDHELPRGGPYFTGNLTLTIPQQHAIHKASLRDTPFIKGISQHTITGNMTPWWFDCLFGATHQHLAVRFVHIYLLKLFTQDMDDPSTLCGDQFNNTVKCLTFVACLEKEFNFQKYLLVATWYDESILWGNAIPKFSASRSLGFTPW